MGAGQADFSPQHLRTGGATITAVWSPVADAGGPSPRWCRLAAKRRQRALCRRVPAARGPRMLWLCMVGCQWSAWWHGVACGGAAAPAPPTVGSRHIFSAPAVSGLFRALAAPRQP